MLAPRKYQDVGLEFTFFLNEDSIYRPEDALDKIRIIQSPVSTYSLIISLASVQFHLTKDKALCSFSPVLTEGRLNESFAHRFLHEKSYI